MTEEQQKCLFCRLSNGEDESTQILHDENDIVVFKDIRPAASHHYLVVPKAHTKDAKHLTSSDSALVEKLVAIGKQFLSQKGGNVDDARLGFHWPPFTGVSHLHLHVISPQAEMGWIARGIFLPESWWFKSPEFVLNRLK